ncbi:MAG: hypothetical protein AAFQ57_01245, partial [Cyanobacteria bacterium J06626_14]
GAFDSGYRKIDDPVLPQAGVFIFPAIPAGQAAHAISNASQAEFRIDLPAAHLCPEVSFMESDDNQGKRNRLQAPRQANSLVLLRKAIELLEQRIYGPKILLGHCQIVLNRFDQRYNSGLKIIDRIYAPYQPDLL